MHFEKLSNGMKINVDQVLHTNIVSINIMVKVGSSSENKFNNGISHMIEHLLFKHRFKGKYKYLTEYIDSIGGYINAFTGKEFTCFVAQITNDYVFEVVDKLSEMLFNPNFKEEDLLLERKVVLQELYQYEEKFIERSKNNAFKKLLGPNNSWSFKVLGTRESLQAINMNDIINYYNFYYTTSNVAVSISGGLKDSSFNRIKETLARINKDVQKDYSPNNIGIHNVFKMNYGEVLEKVPNLNQSYICITYPSISRKDYMKYLKVLILNIILGTNRNSRLIRNIREGKGLTYSISSIPVSYQSFGVLNIQSVIIIEKTRLLLNEIISTIKEFYLGGITQDELAIAKNKINTQMMFGLERTIDRARFWNEVQLFDNHFINPTNIKEMLMNIDKEKIKEVSREIFTKDPVISIVGGHSGCC